jgi:hypothetical protein
MATLAAAIVHFIERLLDSVKAVPGVIRDRKRKKILRAMLQEPTFEWRNLATLARSIGASQEKTRELLISIGARASAGSGNTEAWALTSRVGTEGIRRDA